MLSGCETRDARAPRVQAFSSPFTSCSYSPPSSIMSGVLKTSAAGASSSAPVAHNAVPPPPSAAASRSSRIAPHSHIKGLGLNMEGYANLDAAGFIGQTAAREVRPARVFRDDSNVNEAFSEPNGTVRL